jgi:DNA polymerase III alpha subunit
MKQDAWGQIIYSELDLCGALLHNPQRTLHGVLVESGIQFDPELEIQDPPQLQSYTEPQITPLEQDRINQSTWLMPREYQELDIAAWVLDQCQTDAERQRVGEELLLYLDRDLFPLLQYLKYLVDVFKANNIVWGVGRGSSVSSYVLYLIGVHRINSMYYDLDIHEFLR